MGKIIFIIVMLLPTAVLAQINVLHHSSTVEEGIQRGQADLRRSTGQLLESSARAADILATARSKVIDNNLKTASAFWAKKEMYASHRPLSYLEHENKRLAGLLAAHELKNKKEEFVKNGMIPAPTPHFTYNGHAYISYEQFTKSEDYTKMKIEAELSAIQDRLAAELAEERYQAALVRTVLREHGYIK